MNRGTLETNPKQSIAKHHPIYLFKYTFFVVFFSSSFKIVSDIYIRLVDELGTCQIPIVLIGNKTDLNNQRRIAAESGRELVQQWKDAGSQAAFMETSALTGEVNTSSSLIESKEVGKKECYSKVEIDSFTFHFKVNI